MNAFQKSKYSDLFVQILSQRGKGLNLALNNCYMLKNLFKDSSDQEFGQEVGKRWVQFEKTLKELKLQLNYFAVSYNHDTEQYHIQYEIQSKRHKTQPAKIDISFSCPLPFSFFPSAFAMWVDALLDKMPARMLVDLASGH